MRALSVFLLSAISLVACRTEPQASLEDRTIQAACADVVVIGKVQNRTFTLVRPSEDLLGHGWVTATLHIKRVVKGPKLPPVLPVRYFAHTYMRGDRDFMLVLRPSLNGTYQVTTGQLMSARPLLADYCK